MNTQKYDKFIQLMHLQKSLLDYAIDDCATHSQKNHAIKAIRHLNELMHDMTIYIKVSYTDDDSHDDVHSVPF